MSTKNHYSSMSYGGGRLSRIAGRVVSFAPLAGRAVGLTGATASVAAFGAILVVAAPGGAIAGTCEEVASITDTTQTDDTGIWNCTGAADADNSDGAVDATIALGPDSDGNGLDEDDTASDGSLTITLAEGFGIETASGNAFTLNAADGDILFHDVNPDGSAITGAVDGVNATHSGSDDINIDVRGVVTGGTGDGISAVQSGSGRISIEVRGTVTGGTAAIATQGNVSRLVNVILHDGANVGEPGKVAISDSGDVGRSRVRVDSGATISGGIDMGGGSDRLTLRGGADLSGLESVHGGTDSTAPSVTEDTSYDTLVFEDVSTPPGGTFAGWEEIRVYGGEWALSQATHVQWLEVGGGAGGAPGSIIVPENASVTLNGGVWVGRGGTFLAQDGADFRMNGRVEVGRGGTFRVDGDAMIRINGPSDDFLVLGGTLDLQNGANDEALMIECDLVLGGGAIALDLIRGDDDSTPMADMVMVGVDASDMPTEGVVRMATEAELREAAVREAQRNADQSAPGDVIGGVPVDPDQIVGDGVEQPALSVPPASPTVISIRDENGELVREPLVMRENGLGIEVDDEFVLLISGEIELEEGVELADLVQLDGGTLDQLYEAYPALFGELSVSLLPSVESRAIFPQAGFTGAASFAASPDVPVASPEVSGSSGREAWVAISAGRSNQLARSSTSRLTSIESDNFSLSGGSDFLVSQDGGDSSFLGVSFHYATLSADVGSGASAASAEANAYGAGASWTWVRENGFYVDAQALLSFVESDFRTRTTSSGDSTSVAASLSAGRRIDLGEGNAFTPQAQIRYGSARSDDFAGFSISDGDIIDLRLGGRWERQHEKGTIYGQASLLYRLDSDVGVRIGTRNYTRSASDWGGEVGFGGNYEFSEGMQLFGEASLGGDFEDIGESIDVNGRVGLRFQF